MKGCLSLLVLIVLSSAVYAKRTKCCKQIKALVQGTKMQLDELQKAVEEIKENKTTVEECSSPLGMESRLIKDAQITASSQWDANHAAIQGRLNFQAGGGKQGGWSSRRNDVNQWIQVDLSSHTKLTGIATQGRNRYNQWVTKYKLQYSDDGVTFHTYKAPGQASPKVFDGNTDSDSIVNHQLNPPIHARYIRLSPTAWNNHISLRMELYGCSDIACAAPLGMESRLIKDAQITASSQWDANHAAIQGRLNFQAGGGKQGGWSSRRNDVNQWIQVDLSSHTKLTGIATQGRNRYKQWVTKYKLQYSDDGVTFHTYKAPGQASPKVFDGNTDSDSIVNHQLNPPIHARYIRLSPTAWNNHISLRMELYGCSDIACAAPLGMESRLIKDAQITASSQWDANHAAIQGRLNFQAGGGKQGGWSSRRNDVNQWIQVDLSSHTKLTGIATQGRNRYKQWVTKYKLQYSDDGVTFHTYKAPGQASPKVFDGNTDSDSIVNHQLNPPIHARYIRLSPTAWNNHISLRMELYGCSDIACAAPLGMESRLIKDAQITASSQWDANHAAIQGRLNFQAGGGKQGGWSSRRNDVNQWIQVDLSSHTKLTGIATQGRNRYKQWVTKYKLQYSDDGVTFHTYKAPGQASPKVFDGNTDSDSIVNHQLNPPIHARYIRLSPTAWNNHISLRMELYGCSDIACAAPLGMESRLIKDAQITASSQWDANHAAIQGRLNFQAGGGKQGGWSSRRNDVNQWIQVDLSSHTKLTGIATQGRNRYKQWVTKYKLQYSDDGVTFHTYKAPGQASPKVFDGNTDSDSIVNHQLNPPIHARYIRLSPTAWNNHISLRMELYGCSDIACAAPLGMESRLIKDAQITASSQWDANHAAIQGRLNFQAGGGKQGGWSSRRNDVNQWIQVDLSSHTKLTGIATQGRNRYKQWVTKYKLQYSDDGVTFHTYKAPGQASPKVFDGNTDSDSIVNHQLNPPIHARYIRLSPTAWNNHISLRMELYGCSDIACAAPLGMESRLIKDAQITASSQWDANHAAIQGRLNFQAGGGKQGGWSSRRNDVNQWIQVDLSSHTKLTGIATQGRNRYNQWVTKYKLQYSDDGVTFHTYKAPGQASPKVFDGNTDSDSIVNHQLNPPIHARYIRLSPTAWNNHISLRMELYGCSDIACAAPLGMESRLIKDAQITASSQWDANHAAIQGRLNFQAGGGKQGGWSSRRNDVNQWIQVDLSSHTKLTGIATQGRNRYNQWVTKYKLQYSDDGVTFHTYKAPGQASPKVFDGNTDSDSIVNHQLNPPIHARYIRLSPTAWNNHISLRMELYGCNFQK